MIKIKIMSRKLTILSMIILATEFLFPSVGLAQYRMDNTMGNGSIGLKFFGFYPNSNSNGLKDFSPGLGFGIDGRVNFGPYFALAGEFDYIGVSSASQTYDVYNSYGNYIGSATETAYFNNIALKLDALLTIPLRGIEPFAGIGIVGNYPTFTFSGSSGGYGASTSTSGSGVGMEIVGGVDFMVGQSGALELGLSFPINQIAYFSDIGTNIDVGGGEIMVGYRFIF
jgi:hypothetical protein